MMNESHPPHPTPSLREERLHHRWSQQELADLLGTTPVTISRWENGVSFPSPYFRLKLAQLLEKTPQEVESLLTSGNLQEQGVGPAAEPDQHPDLPPRLWTVPYRRNPHFTGRDALFEQLDRYFSTDFSDELTTTHRVTLTHPLALKGLGGIGKTQIAIEYAYRSREQGRYMHILWINAASEQALLASFTALAELLPSCSAREEQDLQKLVAAIKRWLEHCPQRWLLIVDNADDLSLLQDSLPAQGNGSLLFTTRAQAVGALAGSIEVENLSVEEATTFLLHRAQCHQASAEERTEAANVVIALDGFPLATDQAGAYIEETRCRFDGYLQIYQQYRQTLLARRGMQATNYPHSVATTWSLAFQKIEQTNPAAANFLRLCAFLSPDHIPEELLRKGAPYWPAGLQQAAGDLFTFNQMLEALLAFSLIKRLKEDQTLSIHRLVQVVHMDVMDLEEQRQWAACVVRAVNAVFPRDPEAEIASWPQCARYLEQAQQCNMLIQQYALLLPEAADVLERTGIYLRKHASYTLAKPLFQRALYIRGQTLGSEHLLVAASLNGLADLFLRQGKYEEAEPLYQQALRIREQAFGPDHPVVAKPLSNLAELYNAQGRYEQAEPLYQRAIRIWEQALGLEHCDIGYALHGLADLYTKQGAYERAEPLFQRALRIWERQLGPEHPHMAYLLTGLANLYGMQGKYAQAEPFYQQALAIREQALGPTHPDTAATLYDLATLLEVQRKCHKALSLYQRVLKIREQALGPEHSKTVETRTAYTALLQQSNL